MEVLQCNDAPRFAKQLLMANRLACAPAGLWRGAVFHQSYPLSRAEVTAWDETLLTLNCFAPAGRPPDHIIMSRGVDVTIFPLERVRSL
jgi:uncharacterized protein YqjF (DUF2071 family)